MSHLKSSHILNFLLIFVLLAPNILFADNAKTDSLKQVIISNPGSRQTADNLLTLSDNYRADFLVDSAEKYAKQSLVLSTNLKYLEGIAESNYKLHFVSPLLI